MAEGEANVTTCADEAASCCSDVRRSTVFVVYVRIILHLKPRDFSVSWHRANIASGPPTRADCSMPNDGTSSETGNLSFLHVVCLLHPGDWSC